MQETARIAYARELSIMCQRLLRFLWIAKLRLQEIPEITGVRGLQSSIFEDSWDLVHRATGPHMLAIPLALWLEELSLLEIPTVLCIH